MRMSSPGDTPFRSRGSPAAVGMLVIAAMWATPSQATTKGVVGVGVQSAWFWTSYGDVLGLAGLAVSLGVDGGWGACGFGTSGVSGKGYVGSREVALSLWNVTPGCSFSWSFNWFRGGITITPVSILLPVDDPPDTLENLQLGTGVGLELAADLSPSWRLGLVVDYHDYPGPGAGVIRALTLTLQVSAIPGK